MHFVESLWNIENPMARLNSYLSVHRTLLYLLLKLCVLRYRLRRPCHFSTVAVTPAKL